MSGVIKKHEWTEKELRAAGFERFSRRKQIVFARRLPDHEAPKRILTEWGDTLIAQAGYMICYEPGDRIHNSLDEYPHWPVDPNIFESTYQMWDQGSWKPDSAQEQLIKLGCQAYYKVAGVWAKKLEEDVYIQSLEHDKPILVDQNRVLAIGETGEPYHMGDETFHNRYELANEPPIKRMLKRLIGFFKPED